MQNISRLNFRMLASFSLFAALLFLSSSPALAQTTQETTKPASQETTKPASEVEQLKHRLQQLEQTVVELKGQIESLETKKKTAAPAVVEATYTHPDPAPETAAAETTEPAPKAQDKQGESTFQIYGFAMLDAGYQFKQNHPDWFDVVRPTKLPSFPNEFVPNGHVFYGVRQSRLGVKSSTPTKYGELQWGRREDFLDGFKSDDSASSFPLSTTSRSYSPIDLEQGTTAFREEEKQSC